MPRIAVVFVSYRIPTSRLSDHFKWNGRIYEAYGDQLRVYVVSDVEHQLPDYAQTVVFPESSLPVMEGRPVFSLTMTKNAGIAKAIKDGAWVIVSTDVDIAVGGGSFAWMCNQPAAAVVIPVYRMASSYETRDVGGLDDGCMGTVSMTATAWSRVQKRVGKLDPAAKGPFDERCVGYGKDDGWLFHDILCEGLEVIRDCEVAHIAHLPGDGDRIPGRGSGTCWNRESGFNPENFAKNRKVRTRRHKKKSKCQEQPV